MICLGIASLQFTAYFCAIVISVIMQSGCYHFWQMRYQKYNLCSERRSDTRQEEEEEEQRSDVSRCKHGHIPPITWKSLDRVHGSHVKAISSVWTWKTHIRTLGLTWTICWKPGTAEHLQNVLDRGTLNNAVSRVNCRCVWINNKLLKTDGAKVLTIIQNKL